MHLLWMSELLRYLKARLPDEYRAYLGSGPAVAVGAPPMKPDIGVRAHEGRRGAGEGDPDARVMAGTGSQPDLEVAVATLDPAPALFVERDNRLVAAIELVSPRNKDRPVGRATYLNRYLGYLIEGVHLLIVDVHRRPLAFSFATRIEEELQIPNHPALRPPMAASYRVGEPAATGGRLLAIWRRPLAIGAALPTLPLPLTVDQEIPIDLDATYTPAARDAYLT